MRIVFDARMYGQSSGIEVYIRELSKRIVHEGSSDLWYFLVRKKDFVEFSENFGSENVKIVEADFNHYSISEQLFLPKIIESINPDIVHFPNFNVPIFFSGKFVVTIHDMVHHKLIGNDSRRFFYRLAYKIVMRHAVKKSLAIITISKESKKDILSFYPKKRPEDIYVIPQGVSNNFQPSEIPGELFILKEKYNIVDPYILFVGVRERKKNLPVVAQIFSQIASNFPNLKLVFVGKEDKHHPEVKDEIIKASGNYRDRLIFTDFVEEENLALFYRNAICFITASTFEGFGMPGIEAMSSGTPVIAVDTPVFREVYDNSALYFDINDIKGASTILSKVIADSDFRAKLSKLGLDYSKKFSWETTAIRTYSLYKELLSK